MSYILRHHPEDAHVTPNSGGWVLFNDLYQALCHRFSEDLTKDDIIDIVDTNSKQRFAIYGDMIQCNQGHSYSVDLGLVPIQPPDILYHGTTDRVLSKILSEGLMKQQRHHVHLSKDRDTAYNVGSRHSGNCVILLVDTKRMYHDNCVFYCTENNV